MPIKNQFSELFEYIKSWRHHIHQNPELMYDTIETSKFVETKLKEFGCDEVLSGIGRTGVVALIEGKKEYIWESHWFKSRYGCPTDTRANKFGLFLK